MTTQERTMGRKRLMDEKNIWECIKFCQSCWHYYAKKGCEVKTYSMKRIVNAKAREEHPQFIPTTSPGQ